MGKPNQLSPEVSERTFRMVVEYRGELDFGQTLEPARSIATLAAFAPRWRDSAQALAVVKRETYQEMHSQGFPMVIRASSPQSYIVSRR